MSLLPRLVLASQSPRRRSLLEQAGFVFEVVAPDEAVEDAPQQPSESAADYVARLARQKAEHVAAAMPAECLVLACDTVAHCDGEVLGKPRDGADAGGMLRRLRGREHSVISGVCLCCRAPQQLVVEVDRTLLRMSPLDDQQVEAYLATGLWQGKAGAFGYQDGIDWVRIVSGSESNVVGLPMELLARMLRQWQQSA